MEICDATYQKLEFHEIREVLAGCCSTSLGQSLARAVTPTDKPKLVRQWLQQVRELQAVIAEHGAPPMGGVRDIRDYVRASAFPTPLEAAALAEIAETLAATGPLGVWLDKIVGSSTPQENGPAATAPSLAPLKERVANLCPIAEVIDAAIDPRGQVRDDATPKLATIRQSIETARQHIRAVFERLLRQASTSRLLQYAGATFHADRMVLPLKAEYRGRIKGIVHRSSDTGATLFIEPAESVELNNTIVRLADAESKEITQVLRMLTQRVAANGRTILSTLQAISVLDFVTAKCRYAKKRQCTCPAINDDGILDLREVRHPVLLEYFEREANERAAGGKARAAKRHEGATPQSDEATKRRSDEVSDHGQRSTDHEQRATDDVDRTTGSSTSHPAPRTVVPIDVRLGDDFDILIVTGPNTGGKTVALKTIGLVALMAQCGIPVPAQEGSTMPVYREIFLDVGDEQSLQQSLSTFSSHLSNLLSILRQAGPRSLVLIDELGAGTDPDEGAAIGQAIVAELINLKSKAAITTHLSTLKAIAYTTPRVDNAAVEFDPESLKPAFRLRLGEPGNSNALIIAKRLGMPARIVKIAKQYLADETRMLNKAIAGTLESRREAEEARKAAREEELLAEQSRREHLRQADELRRSQEAFDHWTQWMTALRPGDEVYVKSLKRSARIVRMQLQKQTALVSAGSIDFEIPLREIAEPLP